MIFIKDQKIASSKWQFIRIGAVAGILGSVAGAAGNILHPNVPNVAAEGARAIADSAIWVPIHVSIAISIFLMLMGLAAIYEVLKGGLSGAWARYGYIAAIIGLAIGIILMAADGITAKYSAEAWAQAPGPEKLAALYAADMAEKISFGLVVMFNIFFAGFTFLFYGLAVAYSKLFAHWLGWVAAVVGVGSIVVGVVQAMSGVSSPTVEMLTIIFPTIITLWTAVISVLILHTQTKSES